MTYALVCALCAATSGSTEWSPPRGDGSQFALSAPAASPSDLSLRPVAPALALDYSDHTTAGGDHGSSHMGPMWIVMGVMMVAMMAAAGFYMMRGGNGVPVPSWDVALPPARTGVPAAGLRFPSG